MSREILRPIDPRIPLSQDPPVTRQSGGRGIFFQQHPPCRLAHPFSSRPVPVQEENPVPEPGAVARVDDEPDTFPLHHPGDLPTPLPLINYGPPGGHDSINLAGDDKPLEPT